MKNIIWIEDNLKVISIKVRQSIDKKNDTDINK